nr:synaptobrevin, longin-like domain protein [Tanacetum cinerariifolium]
MIAFLTKSDASEGFDQIVDILNAHMIQLQALIDRKKVIITKDTIRQALHLDNAAGVDCLPNEEIFVEFARMGYEKPSTKLTFYKAFFSAQWKFLIHIILQCMSAKRTAWNEFSSSMASAVICLATGRKFNFSKYIFDRMDVEDAAEDEDDDNEVFFEPTPPTSATPLPSPTQEPIPSPPQAQSAQPSSPPQQQPSQTTNISMTLLNTLLETYATLTKQVANLEQDKIAQAIYITKLKQRIKRMHPKKGKIAELNADEDVTLKDVDAEVAMDDDDSDEAELAEVEEVIKVVTAAKLMIEVVTTATTTIIAAQVPKASALRRRMGVVIQDPEEIASASIIMHSEVKEPMTEAQARKNMMVYLKNMAGFKMDFFKGMTYNEIRPIFKKHYNFIRAFLEKEDEEVAVQEKRKGDSLNQDAAKKQRIDEETEELKTHLQIVVNDDDDVFTEATPLA